MGEKINVKSRNPIWVLLALTAVATLLSAGLAIYGYETAAAIIATATFFLWLSLIIVTTAVIVSWWSAKLMERGAEIALSAQVSDDKRDVAMIKGITTLTQMVARQIPNELPALPLPDQQGDWLPKLNEFTEAEFEEIGDGP